MSESSVKVTHLPYRAPRKFRKSEPLRFVVKWIDGSRMYFRWFKRDAAACDFAQKLAEAGFAPRVLMK